MEEALSFVARSHATQPRRDCGASRQRCDSTMRCRWEIPAPTDW